ncbi:hypothetical protein ABZV78_01000 [Micromonospora sp. NPDC004540]|uniref:hypothetical protein n=1 Tax=Micromonospora sp. NPDC004540 TaxID=3154457 RepID=UPI00339E05AC
MPKRLIARLAAVMLVIAGVLAVPSAASAATFQCGSWEVNGLLNFRACIDDTDQGNMWYEIQIKNISTSTKQVTWTLSSYEKGITFPCTGPWTVSIGAGKTSKWGCVGSKYIGWYYMAVARTTHAGTTRYASSPVLYF